MTPAQRGPSGEGFARKGNAPLLCTPSTSDTVIMNAVGLLVGALGAAGWLWWRLRDPNAWPAFQVGLEDVGALVVLTLAVVVAHELLHGLAVLVMGGRPRFGIGELKSVPYLYTTAPGHLFSRGRYVALTLAPALLLPVLVGACLLPDGGRWVVPTLVFTSQVLGDLWLAGRAVRAPAGWAVEDLRDGLVLYPPSMQR